MNNNIIYNGMDIEIDERVVEATVDNLNIYISKQSENGCIYYAFGMKETNYDSTIEYDEYVLDDYEVETLYKKEDCYSLFVDLFYNYSCGSYSVSY